MLLLKPETIGHFGEKKKPTNIFSVSLNPTNNKLASGGIDTCIKIWDINEVKLLSTLKKHTGAVLCVKWSIDGSLLASSSDDTSIIIWQLDPSNTKKTEWDADNIENYSVKHRLNGHTSDVNGLDWSKDFRFLVSCGLDSQIIVWDASTFTILQKLDGHQGFVKGVAFDPATKFLASQSDDRSLIIFRTSSWLLEKEIKDPFTTATEDTFFRRLSWSPDSASISCANASNGSAPVSSIVLVENWSSETSLVGHTSPIEVTSFNPVLFKQTNGDKVDFFSVVALAGQDKSVSIWTTKDSKPVFVARSLFEATVLDLSWSLDGNTLVACSYDGSVAIFKFSSKDLGVKAHRSEVDSRINLFSNLHMEIDLPQSVHILNEQVDQSKREKEKENILPVMDDLKNSSPTVALSDPATAENVQQIVIKDGKKRLVPQRIQPENIKSTSEQVQASAILMKPSDYILKEIETAKASKALSKQFKAINGDVYSFEATVKSANSCKIVCSLNSNQLFQDFLSSQVLLLSANSEFFSLISSDLILIVYSVNGRRILPTIILESAPAFLESFEQYLLVVLKTGQLHLWDLKQVKKTLSSNVSHLIPNGASLVSCKISKLGLPILSISNGSIFTFDLSLDSWLKLSDGSMFSENFYNQVSNDPVNACKELLTSNSLDQRLSSTSYLENQLAIAMTLKSTEQYKKYLQIYARILVKQRSVSKASELCDFLLGPPLKLQDLHDWDPLIGTEEKRNLLVVCLKIFSADSFMQSIASKYFDLLSSLQ